MKNLSKSIYFNPSIVAFFTLITSIVLYTLIEKPSKRVEDYIYFKLLITEGAYISNSKGKPVKFQYETIFDLSNYNQTFFFQNNFNDNKTTSAKALLKEVKKGDTIEVGVSKNEFFKIQNYGSNFIKNDFYSRILDLYWIKKKDKIIRNPYHFQQEQIDSYYGHLTMLSILFFGLIIRILYLRYKTVKKFT